jgi:hypothetical protein
MNFKIDPGKPVLVVLLPTQGGRKMENSFRHTMQHIGDLFVFRMEKWSRHTWSSAAGIRLTYNIQSLRRKRKEIIKKIGDRVAAIRKGDPESNVTAEPIVKSLFAELDRVEYELGASMKARQDRIEPLRVAHELPR